MIPGTLARAGLDLAAPLQVGRYNEAVTPDLRLPDFGRPDRLALVIGNTRAFWERLREAVRTDLSLAAAAHPVERYVEREVARAFAGERWAARYAHERVAIQRAAELAGLAWLSPAHLSVHPEFGPWIALRAIVVVDRPGPSTSPHLLPCPHCAERCEPAMHRAADAGWDPRTTWRLWLAVRDACPQGAKHRYSDDAIRYHYTKDRAALSRDWLKPVGDDDLPALGQLLESAPSYRARVPGPHEAEGLLRDGIPGKEKLALGYMEGHRLLGFCEFLRGFPAPEVGYLGLLLLREDRQGQGLGRRAFELARERMRQEWPEIRRLRLAVAVTNAEVLGFWERMGFTATGERKPYGDTEVLLMESGWTGKG